MAINLKDGLSKREFIEWARLGDDDQKKLVEEQIKDLSPEELEALQTKIDRDVEKHLDGVKEMIREIRAARKDYSKQEKAESQAITKELNDLKTQIEDLSSDFGEISGEKGASHNKHNVKSKTGEYTLTSSKIDFDGSTFNIDVTQPAGDIFDDPNKSDQAYLLEKGIITLSPNGTWLAAKDITGDNLATQADIDRALADRAAKNPKSKLVWQLDNDTQIQSIRWDATTQKWTIVVKDEKGNLATVVTNAKILDIKSSLSRESLPMLAGLAPELQKNILWMGEALSTRFHTNGTGGTSAGGVAGTPNGGTTGNPRLASIPGYTNIRNTANQGYLNSFFDTHGSTKTGNAFYSVFYEKLIDALFTAMDTGKTSAADMAKVWDKIIADLKAAGFNQRDVGNAIKLGVKAFLEYGNEGQFKTVFGPVVEKLENELGGFANDYGYSQNDAIAILFLELHSGSSGKFANILTEKFAHQSGGNVVAGPWTDHLHNTKVLQIYKYYAERSPFLSPDSRALEALRLEENITPLGIGFASTLGQEAANMLPKMDQAAGGPYKMKARQLVGHLNNPHPDYNTFDTDENIVQDPVAALMKNIGDIFRDDYNTAWDQAVPLPNGEQAELLAEFVLLIDQNFSVKFRKEYFGYTRDFLIQKLNELSPNAPANSNVAAALRQLNYYDPITRTVPVAPPVLQVVWQPIAVQVQPAGTPPATPREEATETNTRQTYEVRAGQARPAFQKGN